MKRNYYQQTMNTVFIFSGERKELTSALDCPSEEAAKDAIMLFEKGYEGDKIADLVCGVLNHWPAR